MNKNQILHSLNVWLGGYDSRRTYFYNFGHFWSFYPTDMEKWNPWNPSLFLKGGVCVFQIFPKRIIQVFLLKREGLVK